MRLKAPRIVPKSSVFARGCAPCRPRRRSQAAGLVWLAAEGRLDRHGAGCLCSPVILRCEACDANASQAEPRRMTHPDLTNVVGSPRWLRQGDAAVLIGIIALWSSGCGPAGAQTRISSVVAAKACGPCFPEHINVGYFAPYKDGSGPVLQHLDVLRGQHFIPRIDDRE